MAWRIAISFAAVAMSISCIATDASATCKFKAKKDIVVILDVGHTDKDSGQISARGVKEYDFNVNLYRVPEIMTLGRLPGEGESDSRWRTSEVRHVGSDTLTPGF